MRRVLLDWSACRAAAGCAFLLLAVLLTGCSGAPKPPVTSSPPTPTLGGAHRTTLASVENLWGSPVPMPDVISAIQFGHPAHRIRLVPGPVWLSGQEVALTFNRGEVTVLAGPATYQDPEQAFRTDLAAIEAGRAAIGVVNKGPALIVQPRTDYTRSNPALVEFELDNLDIQVMSARLGTRVLLAIAGSISTRQYGTITIDPQTGLTFAAAPSSAAPRLTAQQAWARFTRHKSPIPSDVHAHLGLLTSPVGPATAPGTSHLVKARGEAYTALNELVYGYSSSSGCVTMNPRLLPPPDARCIFWEFLDANTGQQIEGTYQKIGHWHWLYNPKGL